MDTIEDTVEHISQKYYQSVGEYASFRSVTKMALTGSIVLTLATLLSYATPKPVINTDSLIAPDIFFYTITALSYILYRISKKKSRGLRTQLRNLRASPNNSF